MAITHAFTSAVADGADATLVQPSDWNADHTIADATITSAMLASGVSGLGYSVNLGFTVTANPADGATYFAGAPGDFRMNNTTDTWAEAHYEIAIPGTITAISYSWKVVGTLGSGEDVTTAIRLNDTTDIGADTNPRMDVAFETLRTTGLSQAVVAGDKIAIKVLCPTWVTNPASVTVAATVYIS